MPKPQSGKILIKEFRLTPYHQHPLVFTENHLKDMVRLIVCEEGTPNGQPRLHYHGYVETTKSETGLRQWLRELSQCTDKKVNGNTLFFTRNPHEHTMGYITKQQKVIIHHGYQQPQITEFFALSEAYQKQKEADRKRVNRTRKMELQDVVDEVRMDLDKVTQPTPMLITRMILDSCKEKQIQFPTRTQMEYYINSLLYPYDYYAVLNYYCRAYI